MHRILKGRFNMTFYYCLNTTIKLMDPTPHPVNITLSFVYDTGKTPEKHLTIFVSTSLDTSMSFIFQNAPKNA